MTWSAVTYQRRWAVRDETCHGWLLPSEGWPTRSNVCTTVQRECTRTNIGLSTGHTWTTPPKLYGRLAGITSTAFRRPAWTMVNLRHFGSTYLARRMTSHGCSAQEKGKLHSGGQKKAEIFNRQFSTVFTVDQPGVQTTISEPAYPPLSQYVVHVKGIKKLLPEINPSKASGPDQVLCRILQELSVELAPVLTAVFTQSLETSTLPSAWHTAYITPVFKKGPTCQTENYWPVSLTCVMCKVMEHIICRHIRANINRHEFSHGYNTASVLPSPAKHSCWPWWKT